MLVIDGCAVQVGQASLVDSNIKSNDTFLYTLLATADCHKHNGNFFDKKENFG